MKKYDDILRHLQAHHWPELNSTVGPSTPAVDEIYSRLDRKSIELGAQAYGPDLESIVNFDMRAVAIIKALTLRVDGGSEATGLPAAVPPDHIHRMERKDPLWCGSFYQANMSLDALKRVDESFFPDGSYLDFGCSSGSMVRVLHALQPRAQWYGCDPVRASIDWAENNIAGVEFYCNPQEPPTHYGDNVFSGVMAISIWSHFSENAALAWFAEMKRIIQPGGWLLFTCHGLTTFRWQCEAGRRRPDQIWRTYIEMMENNFAFHAIGEAVEIDMADWGNSYFGSQWVAKHLSADWQALAFLPGRNQRNQDVWLIRKPM